jgi:hypothetical protein
VPGEHVENADTPGAEIAQNEPLPIDPLENTIGQDYPFGCLQLMFLNSPESGRLRDLTPTSAGAEPLAAMVRGTKDRRQSTQRRLTAFHRPRWRDLQDPHRAENAMKTVKVCTT